ncbi:MAG: hypothetical protein PSX81_09280 [bacterium]|nr:hypothetical protein [bacterium]
MKKYLVALGILISWQVNGQTDHKNALGLNIAGQRSFNELISNKRFSNYFIAPLGIVYKRSFKAFDLRANINAFELKKNNLGAICNDCFIGIGSIKAAEIKLGILKYFPWRKWAVFTGMDLTFSRSLYKGTYQGGFAGQGYSPNYYTNRRSLNPLVGISYRPINQLQLSIELGYNYGRSYTSSRSGFVTIQTTEYYTLPLQALQIYWYFK